jgi:hypothetical protein
LAAIVDEKYFQKENLTQAKVKLGISQFRLGIMEVKHIFYAFSDDIVVSHNKTRFYKDSWHNGKTLAEIFLYYTI